MNQPKAPGIYRIVNNGTGQSYYGSAINLRRRKIKHFTGLRNRSHHNLRLQRAWDKYGEESFSFEVLMLCDANNLLMYEQRFLDADPYSYNICRIAGNCYGRIATEETRRKLSIRCRHIPSVATRTAMSIAHKGIPLSKSHRDNMVAAITATYRNGFTDEHRKKLSAAAIGRRHTPETLSVMSQLKKGKPWTMARRLAEEKRRHAKLSS